MEKLFFESVKYLSQMQSSMDFIFSEEGKRMFREMSQESFENLDVLNLTEEEEKTLLFLYKASDWGKNFNFLPQYVLDAFENIRKRLAPLFIDQTAYLLQEPNKNVLLESIEQAKKGKLTKVDWL